MTSRTLFWIPVMVRLVLLLAAGVAGWAVWDFTRGLAIAFLILIILIFVQLQYMYHLSLWLDKPEEIKLKDGWGSFSLNSIDCVVMIKRVVQSWPSGCRVFGRL